MAEQDFDVVVLGGGSGGYACALRAAQLGLRVALVERDRLGGTCLHVGCIPTKAILHAAEIADSAREAAQFGVQATLDGIDMAGLQKYKDRVVNRLFRGLSGLVKSRGIELVAGHGRVVAPRTVEVDGRLLTGRHLVLATGSFPRTLSGVEADGSRVLTSEHALTLDRVPGSVIVLGGGVIGVEFASIMNHWGVEVTIVEMLDRLIPMEDPDASKELERAFKKRGVAMHLGARATAIVDGGDGVTLTFEGADGRGGEVAADLVLVATGRGPSVNDLGLAEAGVAFDPRKGIEVDRTMRTSVGHLFAVGDVAGRYQLAHSAFREGEVAAENAVGHEAEMDYSAVPRCVYTDPEVAAVGLTEQQARERHGEIAVGKFPFSASARAQMYAERVGWAKTIHETRYGELLGLVIVGPQATELVNAGVVGITAEATIETLADSITAHPTLAEAVKEAALVALGRPIHLPPARRPRAAAAAG
jgi:dihydrolipoamide dehydrogenase